MFGLFENLNCCARSRGMGTDRTETTFESDSSARISGTMDPVITDTIINTEKASYLNKVKLYDGQIGEKKPRYFVLKNDLYYFANKDDSTPKGVILLSALRMQAKVEAYENADLPNGIKLDHQTLAFMKCETAEEASEWMEAMRKVVDKPEEIEGDEEATVKEGFVLRKGFAQEFKKYWFVLRKGRLDYYGEQGDEKPKGSMSLSTVTMKPEINVYGRMAEHSVFQVIYPHTIYMAAESVEEQESWIQTIDETIQRQSADSTWLRKNTVGWKRAGKVREVISPIVDLLRDPFRLDFFRSFITELHSDHLLSFWLDVQQFKRLCKKEDKYYLKPCAMIIWSKYVKEDSDSKVEIPVSAQEKTMMGLENPTPNTFRDSQMAALDILRDFYPQFLTSTYCAEMARSM